MERISRTQKKKAAQALQKKGETLVSLSDADFEKLEIPEELKEAVAMARTITRHEARRRQMQYIGRLMREFDSDVIDEALGKIASREAARRRHFKTVERWRDELVSGNEDRRQWLVNHHPEMDVPELDRLISNARGLSAHNNPKHAARKLFRFLSQLESDSVDV